MMDLIVIAVVAAIVIAACCYIYKARKSGVKCIGCPEGCHCSGGCGGNCGCEK